MTHQELLAVIQRETHLTLGQLYRVFPWLFDPLEVDACHRIFRQSRLRRFKMLKRKTEQEG